MPFTCHSHEVLLLKEKPQSPNYKSGRFLEKEKSPVDIKVKAAIRKALFTSYLIISFFGLKDLVRVLL